MLRKHFVWGAPLLSLGLVVVPGASAARADGWFSSLFGGSSSASAPAPKAYPAMNFGDGTTQTNYSDGVSVTDYGDHYVVTSPNGSWQSFKSDGTPAAWSNADGSNTTTFNGGGYQTAYPDGSTLIVDSSGNATAVAPGGQVTNWGNFVSPGSVSPPSDMSGYTPGSVPAWSPPSGDSNTQGDAGTAQGDAATQAPASDPAAPEGCGGGYNCSALASGCGGNYDCAATACATGCDGTTCGGVGGAGCGGCGGGCGG